MFNRLNISLMVTILGLCAWSWGQSQKIDSLKAENLTQAQTILEQQQANAQLQHSLQVEKQAVENQQKFANELKSKMETERENVRTVLVKEPCANVALPVSVIDSIKRLHRQGNH